MQKVTFRLIKNSIGRFTRKNRRALVLASIFGLGLLLFAILIKLTIRLVGSDDMVFPTQIKPFHTVFDWVDYRYHTWSGRIFAEAFMYIFSPLPLHFWKLASIIIYAIFTTYFFLFYRLFSKNISPSKDRFMLVAAITLPYLLQRNVLLDGMFWVTGSMAYFWISTFGLMAMYPLAYYARYRRRPHWAASALGVIGAIIAASSQEQLGAIMIGLSFALTAYSTYTSNEKAFMKRLPLYLIAGSVMIIVAFVFSVLAPGDKARLGIELKHWLPDFYTVPTLDRIEYSYRWFLEAIINHTGFILVGSWLMTATLLFRKAERNITDIVLSSILAIASLFMLAKGYESVNYWFSFYASWKPNLPNNLSYITFAPWFIVLVSSVVAPIRLYASRAKGLLLALLYLAAFAGTALILLSPTMYVSGWRTLFVPSVILMMEFYLLLDEFMNVYWRHRYILLCALTSLALSQYILTAFVFTHH